MSVVWSGRLDVELEEDAWISSAWWSGNGVVPGKTVNSDGMIHRYRVGGWGLV